MTSECSCCTTVTSVHFKVKVVWIKFFTFGRRFHCDLVTEVASARGGDGGGPDQVLLPMVEVGDPVEEKLWVGFVLAGHLRRHRREAHTRNSTAAFYQSLRDTDQWMCDGFNMLTGKKLKNHTNSQQQTG